MCVCGGGVSVSVWVGLRVSIGACVCVGLCIASAIQQQHNSNVKKPNNMIKNSIE